MSSEQEHSVDNTAVPQAVLTLLEELGDHVEARITRPLPQAVLTFIKELSDHVECWHDMTRPLPQTVLTSQELSDHVQCWPSCPG